MHGLKIIILSDSILEIFPFENFIWSIDSKAIKGIDCNIKQAVVGHHARLFAVLDTKAV